VDLEMYVEERILLISHDFENLGDVILDYY